MIAVNTYVKHDCSNVDVVGSRNGTGIQGEWSMVGSYQTVEHARVAVDRLTSEGIESRISMIGGLSVIARKQ